MLYDSYVDKERNLTAIESIKDAAKFGRPVTVYNTLAKPSVSASEVNQNQRTVTHLRNEFGD